MTVQFFNPTSSRILRAQQVYQILIGAAVRKEILTYDAVGYELFSKQAAGVLAGILGVIAFWCSENGLPALTAIVVNSETGEPGVGIPLEGSVPAEQQKVFKYGWYLIHPPKLLELQDIEEKYL